MLKFLEGLLILILIFSFSKSFGQSTHTIPQDCLRIQNGLCIDKNELGYVDGVTSNIQTQLDSTVHKDGAETITGAKVFEAPFYASSTTSGFHPCPSMSDTEMLAIASPQNGDCVHNTTLENWLVYNSTDSIWVEIGGAGGISNWVTAHDYEVDDVVIYDGRIYQADTDHTSSSFASDIANWNEVSGAILGKSETGSSVNLKQIVFPNSQLTQLDSNGESFRAETGNGNILANPSFEATNAGDGWNVFLNDGSPIDDGLKSGCKTYTSAPVDIHQDSTLYASTFGSGNFQGVARASLSKSGTGQLYLCPRKAGSYVDIGQCKPFEAGSSPQKRDVPFVLGGTSNGVGITSNGVDYTGTVCVDNASVGAEDVKQDVNAVKAQSIYIIQSTSVASGATITGTPVSTGATLLTYSAGTFTAQENVYVQATLGQQNSAGSAVQSQITANGLTCGLSNSFANSGWNETTACNTYIPKGATIAFSNGGPGASSVQRITLTAFKIENSEAYSSQNGNYGPREYTPTITAQSGALANYSVSATQERIGNQIKIEGSITFSGSSGTWTDLRMSIPSGLTISDIGQQSLLLEDTGVNGYAGVIFPIVGTGNIQFRILAVNGTYPQHAIISPTIPFTYGGSDKIRFSFIATVNEWENSNQIIGSFKDSVTSQGSNSADIQSVYFGSGTNCTSDCTTGTCTICRQTGTKISSVTWEATGVYRINGIDGTKYTCNGNGIASSNAGQLINDLGNSTTTYSRMLSRVGGTLTNTSYGKVDCVGTP